MSTTRNRLAGLGASLLILLLVVGTPALLLAIGATPWHDNLGHLGDLLTRPDDGTLALVVIAAVAWIAWAVMAVSFLIEIAAAVRGVPGPRIRGLGLPQHFAGQLVAVAALLFTVAPTMAPVFAPPPAHAAPVAEAPTVIDMPLAAPERTMAAPMVAPVVADYPEPATVEYQVRRGDSLWKIAQEQLGEGTKYTDIVALNEKVLHGRPEFIDPGLVLRLPSDASAHPTGEVSADDETYVVEKGDTLWDIADDELGNPRRYPEIVEASRSTVQPDGGQVRDPDLIRPGWELTIPGIAVDTPPGAKTPTEEPPGVATPGGKDLDPTPHETTQPAESASGPNTTPENSAAETHADVDADEDSAVGWLVPGLMGAGALLAGAVLITVRAHRRTQQRHRRPGFTIAPPPPEVRAVEKTAVASGGPTAEVIDQLDRMLRHLAAHIGPVPKVDAIEIDTRSVTLHLAEPADLPDPWTGSDTTWQGALNAAVGDEDQLPPYPLLASVGQGANGHLWLLDLERLGAVSLTGDDDQARALARHLAAELALSPWAIITEIDTIDVAEQLAPLVPGRLTHHRADDTTFLARIHSSLTRAQELGHGDPEPFRALLVSGARDKHVRSLVDLIRHQTSRSGFAVVTIGAPEHRDGVIELTADGRVRLPHLGLDLLAAGLTADEAAATAAIVDLTRGADVIPVPREDARTGWRALADKAGALVDVLTERRPAGEAGPDSLLPEASSRYEAVASTTSSDIEALAPVVPEASRQAIEAADPHLDADLAEWRDPDSRLPKLTLLGAVTVVAHGSVMTGEVPERRAYFAEIVAFLALHPSGVTSRQVCEAFGISSSRARTDLAQIRQWFGISPRTGVQHLPPANASPAREEHGTNGYQLHDVLVDFDLFRRLRVRAQARGADGIADLVTALALVTGEPFSTLRQPGWSWLLDGERHQESAAFAVVDVAHLVATDALSRGDLDQARVAAETGCMAAPYDEVCHLDLAKVAEAEGHTALADQILDQHVFNRTDDHLPPIDPPARTAEVVKNHGWGHHRRPASD